MFRLKDILFLVEHGLNNVLFIPVDSSKKGIEVHEGVAYFIASPQQPDTREPVKNHPDIVAEWTKEFDPEATDDKGNITHFEETSYLYVLAPFYREVVDFYFKGE